MNDPILATLKQMIEQQKQTNELLIILIEALGDEVQEDEGQAPETYLNGEPVTL